MSRCLLPAALLLGGLLPAQWGPTPASGAAPGFGPVPGVQHQPPPPAIPAVQPPVDHPAYAGQPLIEGSSDRGRRSSSPESPARGGPSEAPKETDAEREAREFRDKRVEGRELKRAIKSVRELRWHEKFEDASAIAAAAGKPIFWVHALGDLDGFT